MSPSRPPSTSATPRATPTCGPTRRSVTGAPSASSPGTAGSTGCRCPTCTAPSPSAPCWTPTTAGTSRCGPTRTSRSSRRYVEGTNVLETTFRTASGVVRVTDSLNTGVAGRLPWAELARRVDGVEGSVPADRPRRPGHLPQLRLALDARDPARPGPPARRAHPGPAHAGGRGRRRGRTGGDRPLRDLAGVAAPARARRHRGGGALPAGPRRHRRGRRPHRRQLAALVRHVQLGRSLGARRRAQRPGPQAADLRPDGRPRRGRDAVAAGVALGREELGLPLRLDPRHGLLA